MPSSGTKFRPGNNRHPHQDHKKKLKYDTINLEPLNEINNQKEKKIWKEILDKRRRKEGE